MLKSIFTFEGLQSYSSVTRGGLKSLSKSGTALAIRFESKNPVSEDKLKLGIKLDCFDSKGKKWVQCTIEKIERNSPNSVSISVKKDGAEASGLDVINWPNNEIVAYCGEKIKDRKDCDPESQNPDSIQSAAIKIAFGAEPFRLSGFTLDPGLKYGTTKGKIIPKKHNQV